MTPITATVERDGYRADVSVHGTGPNGAVEQVHKIDGDDKGRLVHSASFNPSNLGIAARDDRELAIYCECMLLSMIRKDQRR